MKRKRVYENDVESARRMACCEIRDFLKSNNEIQQRMLTPLNSLLAGLFYCGAMSTRQYQRLTGNILDIAFPPPFLAVK